MPSRKSFLFLLLAAMSMFGSEPVRWLETTHNFGAFAEQDGVVTCRMSFVNESDRPVVINQVHVTCGCTSPSFDKKAVEPGDTGSVWLSYNPFGRPGRFEKKVYVDLNTEPQRYTLYIKGSVIASPNTLSEKYPVEAGPLRMVSPSVPFGEVTKGYSKSYFFEVYNASSDTLTPRWISLPDYVSVGSPREEIFPGENMAFTFMVASDKVNDYGLTTDTLWLSTSGSSTKEDCYPVPMMIMVNEEFSKMTPGQVRNAPVIEVDRVAVIIESVKKDEGEVVATVQIKNTGNDPLIIRRVYSADAGISVAVKPSKIKKGKTGELTITIDPAKVAGNILDGRVVIISNDPYDSVLPIRVTAELK